MKRQSAAIIYRLIRYALWGDSKAVADTDLFESLSEEQWLAVHSLALQSGVAAIVLDALNDAEVSIPRAIKMRFISSTHSIEVEYEAKFKAARYLASILEKEGIPMMILKGIGLSMLYPTPNHRPCSDIDIYLFGKQHEADEMLRNNYKIDVDETHHHHTVFHIGNIMVENHYDFIEKHSRHSKARVEAYIRRYAEQEQPIERQLAGQRIYIPSPNMNAMFVAIHAAEHFAAEGISLRHLTDWALLLDKYSEQVDWESICEIADKSGFRPFLDCMNAVCVDYIGLAESKVPSRSHDSELIERMWMDTLNFRKNKYIPKSFVRDWVFRIRRRFANRWKQEMVYNDGFTSSFMRSALTHVLPPNFWRKIDSLGNGN